MKADRHTEALFLNEASGGLFQTAGAEESVECWA